MSRFQNLLLSLVGFVFTTLTFAADDGAKVVGSDSGLNELEQTTKQDDNIMIRQIQSIKGFQSLTIAGQEISATFQQETLGEPHGAIVLLHDLGEDLESIGVITPLRHQLLQYGWSTLTMKLDYPYASKILLGLNPDSDTNELVETDISAQIESTTAPKNDKSEIAPRIDKEIANMGDSKKEARLSLPAISNRQRIEAAIEFLKAKDIEQIIFLGHGQGGIIAINELATIATQISALILVGTPALENKDELEKLNLAILDVFGNQDLQGVSAAVNSRKVLMKRNGNSKYTYREIIGANHVFYGAEPLLLSTVRGWLYTTIIKQEESK